MLRDGGGRGCKMGVGSWDIGVIRALSALGCCGAEGRGAVDEGLRDYQFRCTIEVERYTKDSR